MEATRIKVVIVFTRMGRTSEGSVEDSFRRAVLRGAASMVNMCGGSKRDADVIKVTVCKKVGGIQ